MPREDSEIKIVAEAQTKDAVKGLDGLDKVAEKLGLTLDELGKKFTLVNAKIMQTAKGANKYSATLKSIGKKAVETVRLSGSKPDNMEVTSAVSTPVEPTKRTRGLANYRNIAKEAELVSTRTQIMADGTRRTVELFKKVGEEGTTTYEAINRKIVKVNEQLAKNNEEQDNANKKMGRFEKIWNAFKRIAFYRTIRRAIQLVAKAFTSGLKNLAQFDESVNETMSSYTSIVKQLSNSMGSSLYSVLNALLPVVEKLADGFMNVANYINEAFSQATGQEYFYEATKSVEDFNDAVNNTNKSLYSFDKFESASKGTDPSEMFVKKETSDEMSGLAKLLRDVFAVIKSIWELIGKIVDTVSPLLEPVFSLISVILEIFMPAITGVLDLLKPLFEQIGGALQFVIGIIELLTGNFDKAFEHIGSGFEKLISGMVNMFISFINGIIDAINIIIKPINWIGRMFGASENFFQIPHITWRMSGFAEGGIPDKSEMFYMNEYGKPEALVNTGGTQTNVINIEQLTYGMKQGFVQAIYETGLLDAMQSTVVVEGRNIDNNAVARGLFNALKTESQRRGGNQL